MRTVARVGFVLFIAACQRPDIPIGSEADPAPLAVVAIDMTPLAEGLRGDGSLPTVVSVGLDGQEVALVTLPAPTGLLDGHVAATLPADEAVVLTVDATFANGETATLEHPISAAEDELVRIPLSRAASGALTFGTEQRVSLPFGTRLAIDLVDAAAATGTPQAGTDPPASAIATLLADPAVRTVTPYTDTPSPVDEVGPLLGTARGEAVAVPPTAEPARAAATRPTPTVRAQAPPPAPAREVHADRRTAETRPTDIVSWRLLRVWWGERASAKTDFISYYSYCDCGRPAPNRDYLLTSSDGQRISGRSDRFGLVLVPGLGEASIDFGPTQRPRPRSYTFTPGDPQGEQALLAALQSQVTNERLTALLDLRRAPLPQARHALVAMLEDPELAVWLNAAVTLSYYDGLEGIVACQLGRLAGGDQPERRVTILGALRHPHAVGPLLAELDSDDAGHRALAAWALGFIAHPHASSALELALNDPSAEVRAEAALAMGRIGAYGAMDGLELMLTDTSPEVARRAREAIDYSVF